VNPDSFDFIAQKYKIEFTDKQLLALWLLNQTYTKELLYGGAKGGGKSVLLCRYAWLYCDMIIERFKIPPLRNPIPIGFMGRLQGVDFDDTTLESWKRFVPESVYTINAKNKEIIINKRLKILYGGLDNKNVVQKFNSSEFAFFCLDQAEEIEEDRLVALKLACRLTISGEALPYKYVYSANPRDCYLKEAFVLNNNKDGRIYLPALPSDNDYLPKDYVSRMEYVLRNRPALLKAYRDGCWDVMAGADLVIQLDWIKKAYEMKFHKPVKRVMTIDPARFGDDETVIYAMINTDIRRAKVFGHQDEVYIANEAELMAQSFKPSVIVVDVIGCGAGVASILRQKSKMWNWTCNIIEFNGAERQQSGVPDCFYNRRAEATWLAGEMFGNNEIEWTVANEDIARELKDLERDLNSYKYKFNGDQLIIQPKAEMKLPKNLGRSPDHGDAYIMGLWALQWAKAEHVAVHTFQKKHKNRSYMTA